MFEEVGSVALKIKDPKVERTLEEIINSLDGVRLKKAEEAGFPYVLILEITDDWKKEFELIESVLSSGESKIFLTSSETKPEILIQAMRIGVSEFFSQPLKREEIENAFKKIKKDMGKEPKKTKHGRLISVIASKGGNGATTVAVNLAISLAQSAEMKTISIVDLNLQFGDIPIFLDLDPRYTMAEISKNIERFDTTFLMGVLTRHPSGVYVLPSPDNIEEIDLVNPDNMGKTLDTMRTVFDFVIVDTGRSLAPVTVKILDLSDLILLISALNLPSLRNTRRFLDTFSMLGYPEDKIKLVINRYIKDSEIPLKEAEEILKYRAFWLIPNDYPRVISSIDQGKALSQIDPNAEITRSFKKLAMTLMGIEEMKKEEAKRKEAGFLGRFFRGG